MQETWTDVDGYPGYQVSDAGRVRSIDRIQEYMQRGVVRQRNKKGMILRPNDNGHGYVSVQLGRGRRLYIHRLVASHFVDNPNGYDEVNHLDAAKRNNTAANLEWCVHQENINHSVALGLNPKGERAHHAVLTADQVREIRSLIALGVMQIDIANVCGVSKKCISDIHRRYTWAHVA